MRPLSALLLLALSACSDSPAASAPPLKADIPIEAEEHIFVCTSFDDEIGALVERCVLSSVDAPALSRTIARWSAAHATWNDRLLDTVSFDRRYTITPTEKACLKSALCKEMEREI